MPSADNGRGISVIIPAFNAEDSILESINSALSVRSVSQLICVDDGSTDRTADIIRSVHDNRLLLVQQKNSGVSNARNVGIKLATADYLAFLDADDRYSPEKLDNVYQRLPAEGVDMAVFGVASYNLEDGVSSAARDMGYSLGIPEGKCMNGLEFSLALKRRHTELGSSCRSLFSRNYVQRHNLSYYPGMRMSEDTLFCRELLLFANKVVSFDDLVLLRSYSSYSCTGKATLSDHIEARILLRNRFKEFAQGRYLNQQQSRYVSQRISWDTRILCRDISQLTRAEFLELIRITELIEIDPKLYRTLNLSSQFRLLIRIWRHMRNAGAIIAKAAYR